MFIRSVTKIVALGAFLSAVFGGTFDLSAEDSKLTILLRESPSPANSMAYIHVESLKRLMSQQGIELELSDALGEIWLLSNLDLASLTPRWEAGYATLVDSVSVEEVAKSIGGYVDNVAGKEVARSPENAYLFPIQSTNGLGFLRPADRPLLSQWLSSGNKAQSPEFLAAQANQPEAYLSMMLAVDLNDAFSPVPLAKRLADFESIESLDENAVAKILASAKGFSVIVGRRSLSECILTFDFGIAPNTLLPVANDLLHEILNRNGSAVPEIQEWKAKVDGNKLSFQGPVSEDTLFGVLGIFSLQQEAEQIVHAVTRAKSAEEKPSGPNAYDSKKYFDRVNGLIDRVRKYDAQTTGYRAKWNDQNARRIDELGTLGVDPQCINYGAQVSNMLRQNAMSIRGINVRAGQTMASQGLSRGYYGSYDSWGYGGVSGYYDANSTTDLQRVTGAQARGQGFGSFRNTMTAIDNLTAEVRRAMTDKYQVQF